MSSLPVTFGHVTCTTVACSCLQDPVLLPDSNITVDRATIERHLMSSKTDPFNRSPLTLDAVKPNTALKVCLFSLAHCGTCGRKQPLH